MQDQSTHPFDITIVGAGLIGSVLAIALAPFVRHITLLDKRLVDTSRAINLQSRPLSLNKVSIDSLELLKVWPSLAAYGHAIEHVHVSQHGYFGTTQFHATDMQVDQLGCVIPADCLSHTLVQHALTLPNVTFIQIESLLSIAQKPNEVTLEVKTSQGQQLAIQSNMLFACDGSESHIAQLLDLAKTKTGKQLSGLVTQIQNAHIGHTAYERFTKDGTLALLPLKEARAGLVFTGTEQQVNTLLDLSDDAFTDKIVSWMGGRLSHDVVIGKRFAHTLESFERLPMYSENVLLLGNAARTIYPIAAQGFNLGLRDVMQLRAMFEYMQQTRFSDSCDIAKNLVAIRQSDQQATSQLTKRIGQIFEKNYPGLGHLRGAGLIMADVLPPIKQRIANRALGITGKAKTILRMNAHEK